MRSTFTETALMWLFIVLFALAVARCGPGIVDQAHGMSGPGSVPSIVHDLNPFDDIIRAIKP